MTDPEIQSALTRIEAALGRLERLPQPSSRNHGEDSRYLALRARTQAALAGLETVIAQVGREAKR